MTKNDFFQLQRAKEAILWAKHPDRQLELLIDKAKRVRADIKAGHSPLCGLNKCHATCKSNIKHIIV